MADILTQDLSGKRVLITGSSRGIGAAAARAFASCGARVVLHAHASREAAQTLGREIGAAGVLFGDFTKMAEVTRVIDEATALLGGLDVLVNNAGTMVARVPIEQITDEKLTEIFDLNARSAVFATKRALDALKASKGCIINTVSIASRSGGSNGAGPYGAAKGYLSTYTRALANELAPHGIRVNGVSPGVIMTDFHRRYSTPERLAATAKAIPMGRLGTDEDCAGAYLFLAAPSLSGYVTGQMIEVNGGQLMP
jgi:3-oxoacyl-[acyl-carrier protein] reductase